MTSLSGIRDIAQSTKSPEAARAPEASMNHRCENVDPQRDGMDEEIERAIQKGTISWKMIHRDSWPDHPEYKAKVCHS